MIALGSTRRDSWTSSAMEPADSKPTNENPMKATMPRNGLNSQSAPCPVPAPLNKHENEWVRWKNSSAMPIPSEEISSAVMRDVEQAAQELAADHVRDRAEDQDAERQQAGLRLAERVEPERAGRGTRPRQSQRQRRARCVRPQL